MAPLYQFSATTYWLVNTKELSTLQNPCSCQTRRFAHLAYLDLRAVSSVPYDQVESLVAAYRANESQVIELISPNLYEHCLLRASKFLKTIRLLPERIIQFWVI
jgi:hypothetical protein